MEHQPNKKKTRYQCLESPQSSQTQIPRYQLNPQTLTARTICIHQKNSNFTTVGPEKWNIAKEQDKDFKITIRKIFKIVKEDMNKSPNETYENADEWNQFKIWK